MKLVDILARELKEWPSDDVFAITQDEGGALNGSTAEDPPILKGTAWGGGAFYLDCPVNAAECFVLDVAEDHTFAIINQTEWQAAVDALKVVWTGETPPPVGIEVEIHNDNDYGICDGAESFIGFNHEVKAVFANANGTTIVAVEDSSGACMCFRSDMCRPIRTPEQIAKAKRNKACDEMFGIMSSPPVREGNRSDMAEALYDAGYRKTDVQ